MKAILMSVKPEECEKIFSGEKTIEVRKTAPKLKPPFKEYVYQTKHKGKSIVSEALNAVYGGGKVVGEFACNKMNYKWKSRFSNGRITSIKRENDLYIDDPKRYDTPKDLGEFGRYARKQSIIHKGIETIIEDYKEFVPLTRPPQSWCYVEEIER